MYLEFKFDIWVELYLKIYYKSYIPFVCERIKKFLIFRINFVFIRDFSLIEIHEVLDVRIKAYGWLKKSYCFDYIWSSRSMFGLNCILRYIISHIYHLSVSKRKSFWFSASIPSSFVTLHPFRYMGYCVWGVKRYGWLRKAMISLLFGVRGGYLAWIVS